MRICWILTRGLEELHVRVVFCSTPTLAEHNSTIASKAKYETAIHNSAKCFSSHGKMQLICNLASKTLFNKKIKQTMVFHKMNRFSVYYHHKVKQKLYTAN